MKIAFFGQKPMMGTNRPIGVRFGKDGGSSGLGAHRLPANFPLQPRTSLLQTVRNWGVSILNALGRGAR